MVKKNNKGRVAGSGTVSLVRKERYKLACQERDSLLAEAKTEEDKAKAYLVQKEWQRKPLEKTTRSSGAAASSSEVKKEEKKAAPCQKEQDKSLPCQKESEKSWVDVAKAQASKPLAWKKKEENNKNYRFFLNYFLRTTSNVIYPLKIIQEIVTTTYGVTRIQRGA